MKNIIIAETDTYDNDGIRDHHITFYKKWDNENWVYCVEDDCITSYYPDYVKGLKAYNKAVYNDCI